MEDATEYFRRAQDERQLIQLTLVDLHALEYQTFLKKAPSLQFKEGECVWVRRGINEAGLHPGYYLGC